VARQGLVSLITTHCVSVARGGDWFPTRRRPNSTVTIWLLCSGMPFWCRRLRSSALFRAGRSRINVRKYSPLLRGMLSCNDILDINCKVDIFSSNHSLNMKYGLRYFDLLTCYSYFISIVL
jgi:hypothetical protein